MGSYTRYAFGILFNIKGVTKMGELISQREFWDNKVDDYIHFFLCNKHTTEKFVKNMRLMGFKRENIYDFLFDIADILDDEAKGESE
jgi:hypothetical protein